MLFNWLKAVGYLQIKFSGLFLFFSEYAKQNFLKWKNISYYNYSELINFYTFVKKNNFGLINSFLLLITKKHFFKIYCRIMTTWVYHSYRVLILNRGSRPRKRTGRNWCKFYDQNVQRHSVTSLETARSLSNGPSWGGGGGAEGEVCILRSPGIAASPISLLSMGGVCGRSSTAGKILFTGRQTCSLYLVLYSVIIA